MKDERDSRDDRAFWNMRAKTFGGYRDDDTYRQRLLDIIENRGGVDFKGKKILDLGCGNGGYTLRIAAKAEMVTALDISDNMLDGLAEDASSAGIKNIKYVRSDWSDYEPEEKFDIIFCSLTPAVKNAGDLDKIFRSTKQTVYITSISPMKTDMLEDLYENYGIKRGAFPPVAREWLEKNNIQYKEYEAAGSWTKTMTAAQAEEDCRNALESRGTGYDREQVKELIEKFKTNEGNYISETKYDVRIYIW